MVEIFLNVERLSAGQMELKREAISVKQMMEVCVERVRPLAERKHIGITLEPVPEDLNLTGDRELVEYACYNLLTNAVKYSPQRTEVTASARKDDSWIHIAVKDQGIGMDQKEVKQIFQKFYRTKKAEESGEAGTGIGLSIVQQIVEQHGGRIEVTSRPGAGSCFTVVMAARAARRRVHRGGTTLMQKLLLVEDDPALQFTILTALEAQGYAVDAVSTTGEAIERLSEQRLPDRHHRYLYRRAHRPGRAGCRQAQGPALRRDPDDRPRHGGDRDGGHPRRRIRLHRQALRARHAVRRR